MKNIAGHLDKYMWNPVDNVANNTEMHLTTGLFTTEKGLQKLERTMQSVVRKSKCSKPRLGMPIVEYPVTVVSRGSYCNQELVELFEMPEESREAFCGNLQMAWLRIMQKIREAKSEKGRPSISGRLGACVVDGTANIIMRGNMHPKVLEEIKRLAHVEERYLEKSRINEYVLTAQK